MCCLFGAEHRKTTQNGTQKSRSGLRESDRRRSGWRQRTPHERARHASHAHPSTCDVHRPRQSDERLEDNQHSRLWTSLGASVPKPQAILAVSAHWYLPGTRVTAMEHPRTIHDFGGFPEALSQVQYPAPGSPALAARIARLLEPVPVRLDTASWGLDHGTWSILVHMFPDADVPVVQLSIDSTLATDELVSLGAQLSPLLEEGVLVLCSGNVVHNLGLIDWGASGSGADWARSFDERAAWLMTHEPRRIGDLERHEAYRLAAPTPEHLAPLHYLAGIASARGTTAEVLGGGLEMGSLSMTSFSVRPGAAR
ncbi:MAG: 4,5-DOPA dioxygenase extradiol [Microthrixaceae bacterium]